MKKLVTMTLLCVVFTLTIAIPAAEACGGRLGSRLKAVGRFILRR